MDKKDTHTHTLSEAENGLGLVSSTYSKEVLMRSRLHRERGSDGGRERGEKREREGKRTEGEMREGEERETEEKKKRGRDKKGR